MSTKEMKSVRQGLRREDRLTSGCVFLFSVAQSNARQTFSCL